MSPSHPEITARTRVIAERARWSSEVAALREPAFRVIHRMEGVEPHLQFNAVMLAARALAEALGLDPHEEIVKAGRMMADAEGPHTTHVQAIRDFARGELART